ncbi:MAG: hypothetical protein ACMXYK_01935 [Candidatus Woesearchaeota archaeon]
MNPLLYLIPAVFLMGFTDSFVSVFSYIDFLRVYEAAPTLWDAIILIIFFAAVAQFALAKVFSNKRIAAIIGIILGLATALFLANRNIMLLAAFSGPAVLLFMVIFYYAVYRIFLGLFNVEPALKAHVYAYAFMWPLATSTLPGFLTQIAELHPALAFAIGIGFIAWLICLGYTVWQIGSLIAGLFKGESGGTTGSESEEAYNGDNIKDPLFKYEIAVDELDKLVTLVSRKYPTITGTPPPVTKRLEDFKKYQPAGDFQRYITLEDEFEKALETELNKKFVNKKELQEYTQRYVQNRLKKSNALKTLNS